MKKSDANRRNNIFTWVMLAIIIPWLAWVSYTLYSVSREVSSLIGEFKGFKESINTRLEYIEKRLDSHEVALKRLGKFHGIEFIFAEKREN